jgi:hypothetical protein
MSLTELRPVPAGINPGLITHLCFRSWATRVARNRLSPSHESDPEGEDGN